jgi:hypothetical protein
VLNLTKVMSRRDWSSKTFNKFRAKLIATNGLAFAGKVCGPGARREHWFAVIRLCIDPKLQRLRHMPESDVVLEGGRVGETPRMFVERNRKYFKTTVDPRGKVVIDYEYIYYVFTWSVVGWIHCEP